MSKLTEGMKIELATKLAIFDALEKGHTAPAELVPYMNTETFMKCVQNYLALFNENF